MKYIFNIRSMSLFFLLLAFHAHAVKSPDYYLSNRIDVNDKNYATFFSTLELLSEKNAKIIVETQTFRNFAEDGKSTLIFADWASQNGANLYSIGNSHSVVQIAKSSTLSFGSKIFVVYDDVIEYLKKFDKGIDLLYLNSKDYDSTDVKASQMHYLKEIVAAYSKLHKNSVVVLDDISEGGVGNHAANFLIAKGWLIVQSGYQIVLIPSDVNL